ncbi:MAG: hypothetical protein HY360_16430 [Verrucomicrobia bacterium]|nr:hypothetical protein [Verrucomicrobiota bacterium]
MNEKLTYALIDERLIEDTHFLARLVEPPCLKQREPVVAPGQMYGTVIRESPGRWKMWYLNGRQGAPPMADICYRTCFATSTNGIEWEKPALNLIEVPDKLSPNNAVMDRYYRDPSGNDVSGSGGPEGFEVIDAQITPHPAARARYTALFRASPCDRHGGVCAAYSEDGLRWTAYPENPIIGGISDTLTTTHYDPVARQYVLYGRPFMVNAGRDPKHNATRKIARYTSPDLANWSLPRIVFATDDLDAPPVPTFQEAVMGTGARGRDKQFYNFTAWPDHNLLLGLVTIFHVEPGTLSVELVHSYDGIQWRRELNRPIYITDGKPDGMQGNMFIPMQGSPFLEGDEHFLYVSQTPVKHCLENIHSEAVVRDTKIMLLATKRDRWAGYAAGEVEGELASAPMNWSGGRLTLNARIERGGHIAVSFDDERGLPMTGFDLDLRPPIEAPLDAVDIPFTFGPDIGAGPKRVLKFPTRGPVRLRIKVRKAALFGWAMAS